MTGLVRLSAYLSTSRFEHSQHGHENRIHFPHVPLGLSNYTKLRAICMLCHLNPQSPEQEDVQSWTTRVAKYNNLNSQVLPCVYKQISQSDSSTKDKYPAKPGLVALAYTTRSIPLIPAHTLHPHICATPEDDRPAVPVSQGRTLRPIHTCSRFCFFYPLVSLG